MQTVPAINRLRQLTTNVIDYALYYQQMMLIQLYKSLSAPETNLLSEKSKPIV